MATTKKKAKTPAKNNDVQSDVLRSKNHPLRKFTKFLIVGEDNAPMAWDARSNQLCFCYSETWQDEPHPAMIYTLEEARELIAKTIKNRKRWKMTEGEYKVMPVG